jgi:hypothetical protein
MPYLIQSIGAFSFISLQGEYDWEQQRIAIDDRPGVEGMEFTLLGVKGQPFVMVSLVDVDSFAAGKQLIEDYKDLVAGNPVTVWKNSEVYVSAKVLNVTPLRLAKIQSAAGNKRSTSAGAILECRWDLVAIP